MSEFTISGSDLAKRLLQLLGARDAGSVVFRKNFSRVQVPAFFARRPDCVVAIEACATSHGWGCGEAWPLYALDPVGLCKPLSQALGE